MERLEPTLRSYPWGSRSLLARLRGRPVPAEQPEAELWFGAHAAAPSTVRGEALDAVIAADPVASLGARVAAEFDGKLPFLLKLLAAGEPLSIQAHPSKQQAEEGYAREDELGIPLNSPERDYRDRNHKPELIVALTPFHAIAGFRPPERTRELFDALECPALDRYVSLLGPAGDPSAYRALFTTWIALPPGTRDELILDLAESAQRLIGEGTWISRTAENFLALAEQYPNDTGTLASLLLNHVELQPGEALYLGAGQLHAYLRGMGVEIMANSDNVLRGGLTTKHVDVPELVRIVSFEDLESPFASTEERGAETVYGVPCEDFALSRMRLSAGDCVDLSHDGPSVALCTEGTARVSSAETEIDLAPGEAAWIPAGEIATAGVGDGAGELFIARA
ncbi:mannose-6-phosphate isomerase, class I [Corynebacterium sp.]|uniref:mannose-6-phosphate isomerase, class I n=1 Tax=Corynebacterium sp. TaxID=1720 RepID=UPI002A91AE4C|nr:mannose-6-phosphate isomerase, class I [Corynebacterium sp.]MDY5786319.1 mannose-6-phosphate isomerase, class I [Corynebacterium sp.]